MQSLKGKLLISGGGLYDPNFRHTVVLIGEHDARGAVGVVLNRPMDTTVADAVPTLAALVASGEPLFDGGPVEPQQAVLLRRARVFLGHAGWGPGQLEAEMEADSWIIEDPTADDAFTTSPEGLWRRVLERKGPPWTDIARIPFDPTMN